MKTPSRGATSSGAFLILFAALSAMFAVGQLNRSAGGVMSPVLIAELGLGAAQLSIVIGILFLAQGLSQLPAGVLLDRFGARRTIPVVAAIGAVGMCVFALSSEMLGLVSGRTLIGIGFATVMSGTYVLFTRWVPPERFSTISGRFLFIGGIGGLCATTPLAVAVEAVGWRTTFLWLGAATLAICVATYAVVRDAPEEGGNPVSAANTSLLETVIGLGRILRNRTIWPMLIVAICIYSPAQILLGIWAGPFLQEVHNLDAIDRSHILLVMALAVNFGALLFGPVERLLDARRAVVLGSMAIIAALFALLAAVAYASLWQTIAIFIAIPLLAPFYIVMMSHTQAMFPREAAGRALTSVNMFASSGIFVMQNLTGLAVDAVPHENGTGSLTGYRLAFAVMAVTMGLAALLYTRTPELRPSERREK
jgi:sugar phosphate permease